MGFGRYHWFIDDSGPDRSLLFIRHLKRVIALAEKYGFTKPAVWFDNLFEINYKGYITPPVWLWRDFSREIRESFPKVRLIFWNYVIRDTACLLYTSLSRLLGQLADKRFEHRGSFSKFGGRKNV